jgi:hypothetical protein
VLLVPLPCSEAVCGPRGVQIERRVQRKLLTLRAQSHLEYEIILRRAIVEEAASWPRASMLFYSLSSRPRQLNSKNRSVAGTFFTIGRFTCHM